MPSISDMTVTEAREYARQVTSRIRNMREQMVEKLEASVDVVAVMAGGALSGYLMAHYSGKEFMGLSYNLWAGMGLTAIGVFELIGKESHIAAALGEGLLAHYAGVKVQYRERNKAQPAVKGLFSPHVGASGTINEQDIVRAVERHTAAAA